MNLFRLLCPPRPKKNQQKNQIRRVNQFENHILSYQHEILPLKWLEGRKKWEEKTFQYQFLQSLSLKTFFSPITRVPCNRQCLAFDFWSLIMQTEYCKWRRSLYAVDINCCLHFDIQSLLMRRAELCLASDADIRKEEEEDEGEKSNKATCSMQIPWRELSIQRCTSEKYRNPNLLCKRWKTWIITYAKSVFASIVFHHCEWGHTLKEGHMLHHSICNLWLSLCGMQQTKEKYSRSEYIGRCMVRSTLMPYSIAGKVFSGWLE